MTPLTAAEVDRRLSYFITDRFEPVEARCEEIRGLEKEVAEIRGQMAIMTRLMWGIILALVGLLIQGAIG